MICDIWLPQPKDMGPVQEHAIALRPQKHHPAPLLIRLDLRIVHEKVARESAQRDAGAEHCAAENCERE